MMKPKKENRYMQLVPFEDIGKVITEHRRNKGMSRKEFAALTGVSEPSIYKLQRGEEVGIGIIKKVLEALDVKMFFLLGIREEDVHRLTEL